MKLVSVLVHVCFTTFLFVRHLAQLCLLGNFYPHPARPGISHLAYMSHGHWPQETNQDPRKKKNHAAPGQPLTRVLCFTEVSSCVCWRITTILVILTVPSFKAPHYTIICRYAAIQLASACYTVTSYFLLRQRQLCMQFHVARSHCANQASSVGFCFLAFLRTLCCYHSGSHNLVRFSWGGWCA